MIKSALVLAQTSAESEHSLSVNVRFITQERASLSEKTIVGLHVMRVSCQVFWSSLQLTRKDMLHKILRKQPGLPMQHTKNK